MWSSYLPPVSKVRKPFKRDINFIRSSIRICVFNHVHVGKDTGFTV